MNLLRATSALMSSIVTLLTLPTTTKTLQEKEKELGLTPEETTMVTELPSSPQETPTKKVPTMMMTTTTTTVTVEQPLLLLVSLILKRELCTLKKKMKKSIARTTKEFFSPMAFRTPSRALIAPKQIEQQLKYPQKAPQKRTCKAQLGLTAPHWTERSQSKIFALIQTMIGKTRMVILHSPKMRTYQRSQVLMTQLTTWCTYTWNTKGILPYGISRYKSLCLPTSVTHPVSYLTLHTARPPG